MHLLTNYRQAGHHDPQLSGKQALSLRSLSADDPQNLEATFTIICTARTTIIKLITGWNVDGSRYALYTSGLPAKITNARCTLCLATDSDLHWICDCPCPALKTQGTHSWINKTSRGSGGIAIVPMAQNGNSKAPPSSRSLMAFKLILNQPTWNLPHLL